MPGHARFWWGVTPCAQGYTCALLSYLYGLLNTAMIEASLPLSGGVFGKGFFRIATRFNHSCDANWSVRRGGARRGKRGAEEAISGGIE